ncbi:MAG: A/G-specific adenine glycosylase [Phycisphaerales bacterium]|nr:A/G-specific adenine glycosylase [Phycisphaerales bacterium]
MSGDDGSARRRLAALERWFTQAARDLPWRRRRTGYSALVAEAMLQQTQVARVVDRYRVFMRRFPTVKALAEASEDEVLAAWQGLGYYRRARNLHRAARSIVDEHAGRVPRDAATLQTLPGVGRYTAGAIASIAYGRPAPIVDGNVTRVLARWAGREPAAAAETWDAATRLVNLAEHPGVLNEALMELGATVCPPVSPRCEACPVARWCEARAAGTEATIPAPRVRATRTEVHHHCVLVRRASKVSLEQRPDEGLWARMWQPPTVEAASRLTDRVVRSRLALPVTGLRPVGGFVHLTTHRRVCFHVLAGTTRSRRGVWRGPGECDDLAMSNAHRRVLAMGG